MFKDERFQSGQGKYDKYGRRVEKKTNELKKFYRLEDEDDDDENKQVDEQEDNEPAPAAHVKKSSSTNSSTSDDDDEDSEEKAVQDETIAKNDEKLTRLEYLNRMARGELAPGSDDSSDDSDSDSDDENDGDVQSEPESEKEDVPMGEETKRFAVQNCDWSRIRAVDIFALCQSFAPATGAVRDVTIYPSDFGLQKMVRCSCVVLCLYRSCSNIVTDSLLLTCVNVWLLSVERRGAVRSTGFVERGQQEEGQEGPFCGGR